MRLVVSYLIGLLFGLGMALSGMMNPAKVLNFFDITGHWDPSLALVMLGAVSVTFIGYRGVLQQPAPRLESHFALPRNHQLDASLIGGSALFGIGWGIAGFCPGGALPALGTGQPTVYLFIVAVILGMLCHKAIQRYRLTSPTTA